MEYINQQMERVNCKKSQNVSRSTGFRSVAYQQISIRDCPKIECVRHTTYSLPLEPLMPKYVLARS